MERLTGIVATALLLASGGQATVWAQGGKPPRLSAVPLSVVIENSVPPTTANPLGEASITGDGFPYEDGEAHPLRANIDEYGNLIIAFGRPVHFQYGSPLPGTRSSVVTDEPVSGWHSGAYISTLNRTGAPPLQNLAPGSSQCVKLNFQYDHPGGWWLHGYNRGADNKENDTSYAVVYRVSVSPDVWTVEPRGGQVCGDLFDNPDSTAAISTQTTKGKSVNKDYGDYVLPFKLTLTRKQ